MMFGVEQLSRVQSNIESGKKVHTDANQNSDIIDVLPIPNTEAYKAKSTVINRKIFIYGKERGKAIFFLNSLEASEGIPENWKNYLERGYTEFKEIRDGYQIWATGHSDKVAKVKGIDQEKEINDPSVPEISVKVPLDDLETASNEKQEW
jgi:hypothetical protein